MGLKIYIDDVRERPEEYTCRVDSLGTFLELLLYGDVDKVSFDHDLDGYAIDGYDFAHVARLLAENGDIDRFEWNIHSANPVGAQRIEHELKKADRAWREK